MPVHSRQGEFDHLWITDDAQVAEFKAGFTSAPWVDARLVPNAGHCIDFHLAARAFQLEQLAFALEAALHARRPAASPESAADNAAAPAASPPDGADITNIASLPVITDLDLRSAPRRAGARRGETLHATGRYQLSRRWRWSASAASVGVAAVSAGSFSPDPQAVYRQWAQFTAWHAASKADDRGGGGNVAYRRGRTGRAGSAAAPRCSPIGMNYRAHAAEAYLRTPQRPTRWCSPSSRPSVTGPGGGSRSCRPTPSTTRPSWWW